MQLATLYYFFSNFIDNPSLYMIVFLSFHSLKRCSFNTYHLKLHTVILLKTFEKKATVILVE